ncbi:MAG: amidophosphoribosyltransferase [Candidatus Thermoplasmatota archaeon]|nr:amidophosphoribosyltransferase [Candidatus Thermoplasmatota archaeon]
MTGLFGVVSDCNCISDLYYGVDYHSHLGTQFGGIAFIDDIGQPIKKIHDIRNSQFKSKFYEGSEKIETNMAIGCISDWDPQPLTFLGKWGPLTIVCSGLVTNKGELVRGMIAEGRNFAEVNQGEVNQTDLIANLINLKGTLVEGIVHMQEMIEGSISLLILTKDGIIAARDKHGVSPLAVGVKEGSRAVASETCAFANLGYALEKELGPGEIVLIEQSGVKVLREVTDDLHICSFLWIYTGFPGSTYEGINVERVRERSGALLAMRDKVQADLASGVPDSGTSHAIGYAMESGLPFRRVLLKYTPGYGRSYTPPTQELRDKIALMKLIPNGSVIKGKRIILCEDSIVRGTQLKNFTVHKLREGGAEEVHIRPACPPLMFPCIYMLSTRSARELVARRAIAALEHGEPKDISKYLDPDSDEYAAMVEWVRNDLDLDSLMYQRLDDMVEAIGLPEGKLCTYCWTGKRVEDS